MYKPSQRINLPKRHPFKVRADSVHPPLVNAHPWTIVQERFLGVVQTAVSIPVAVVGNFCALSDYPTSMEMTILTMVIPHRNPRELLVRRKEVEIGAILQPD